jgi:enoyl-CoA hydratase/carnithine racemase
MPNLDRDGDVFLLDLGDGENRFHPEWIAGVSAALDEVAAAPAPRALVTTARGKIWSNGLDLEWLGHNQDQVDSYVDSIHALFAQTLALPVPTVAAIQGHVFAGGAMFALAHDWRVMRADRGWFCLPEADINIPFTPCMSALIQAKVRPDVATDAMIGAIRFGGEDALARDIVTAAVGEEDVLPAAVQIAQTHAAKLGPTLATIKQRMYAGALASFADVEGNRLGVPGV